MEIPPALAAYAQLRTARMPLAAAGPGALEIARFYLEPRLHGTGFAGAMLYRDRVMTRTMD